MSSRPGTLRSPRWVLAVVLALANAGCGTQGAAKPLRIAAASDLQSALPELAKQFESKTGIAATLTFGASGQLSEQIKAGAPFDVFLAANVSFVRDLSEQGLVKPDSVHPYARGSLVLAVYGALRDTVQTLADLKKPEVKKIAVANPATAPYGRAGKTALERASLWALLEPKIVVADSVRQALYYVQHGEAEAGLIGKALATVPEIRAIDVDPKLYDPIIQALGIVSATSRAADAEQFAGFVLGDDGQRILKQFGFAPAESAAAGLARQVERLPAAN
jgi:molybdate transport system substrate-binding protein